MPVKWPSAEMSCSIAQIATKNKAQLFPQQTGTIAVQRPLGVEEQLMPMTQSNVWKRAAVAYVSHLTSEMPCSATIHIKPGNISECYTSVQSVSIRNLCRLLPES
jgi:hypothetical protein